MSPALTFEEMSGNSKRYLEASGEWELVTIVGDTSILKFGIDEWDIITFWVRKECACEHDCEKTIKKCYLCHSKNICLQEIEH